MLTASVQLAPDAVTLMRAVERLGGGLASLVKESGVLRDLAITYRNLLMGHTPVDTGWAKSQWMYRMAGALEAEFYNNATSGGGYCYPLTLEYGSVPGQKPWPNPGPRTVLASNHEGAPRIYSRQAPGGISRPAFRELPVESVVEAVTKQLETMFR